MDFALKRKKQSFLYEEAIDPSIFNFFIRGRRNSSRNENEKMTR